MYTGLAAGVYSGLTYGLKEARGTHDWVILFLSANVECELGIEVFWVFESKGNKTWAVIVCLFVGVGADKQCSCWSNYRGGSGTYNRGLLS